MRKLSFQSIEAHWKGILDRCLSSKSPKAIAVCLTAMFFLLHSYSSSEPQAQKTDAPDKILSAVMPLSLLTFESPNLITESQVLIAYLRELRSHAVSRPEKILVELSLNRTQLNEIMLLISEIEATDLKMMKQRLSAMCEFWRDTANQLSDLDRANFALSNYTQHEIADLLKNKALQSFFSTLNQSHGNELATRIKNHMLAFEASGKIANYSWENLVHSVGAEIDQIEYSCGQQ